METKETVKEASNRKSRNNKALIRKAFIPKSQEELLTVYKNCTGCDELKPLKDFNVRREVLSGVSSKCKKCNNLISSLEPSKIYGSVRRTAEWYKEYRTRNKKKLAVREKVRKEKNRENLTDAYVSRILVTQGFKREDISKEIIELKRIIIKTTRLCLQLQKSQS